MSISASTIERRSFDQSLRETVDGYFDLKSSPSWKTALKVASYFTLIIPAIMMTAWIVLHFLSQPPKTPPVAEHFPVREPSPYSTAYTNYSRKELKPIDHLTNACKEKLIHSRGSERAHIRQWVVAVYKAHGYNISADRGGHFMDVLALNAADELLNPVVLKELEKFSPHSSQALQLRDQAVSQRKPVSELVFQ